jgi:alanyl-tRNA synthetase
VPTTERLYYFDSHLFEFDATVLAAREIAPGRAAVILDRTAFYPTGGGQPHDTGTLGAARVVDCAEAEAEGVIHVCEGDAPRVGARVRGRVDAARRLDHIQQHTGQHLLSQSLVKLYDAPTRSFRMAERACEIDVELAEPSPDKIERAVDLANQIVWEDRPMRVLSVTAEEAARLPLRKDSAREGTLRVIEIENFDLSPCGGTHAARTGEVGLVAVRAWERAKGMTRIEFVAGARALADYRLANATARGVATLLGAGRDDAASAAARLVEENKGLARRVRALEEAAAHSEAEALARGAERLGASSYLVARVLDGERDADALKRLASSVAARPGHVALLGARAGDQARLVFARAPDAPGDMNELLRAACALLEGRGGGRPDLAQGGGRLADHLAPAIEAAAAALRHASA